MSGLEKVHTRLEQHHVDKLVKGGVAQLKHHHLDEEGPHHLMVHKSKATKMRRARKNKKGARIQLTREEIEKTIEGGGFGDFINRLKNIGSFIKNKVIDNPLYQQYAKPAVRKLVDTGLQAATPYLGAAAPLATAAVNKIGEATSAYGFKKIAPKSKTVKRHMTKKTVVNEPISDAAFKQFYMESMAAPRPGGPAGFTAFPQSSYGAGMGPGSIHHHHYYPHPHHSEMYGRSFRLA